MNKKLIKENGFTLKEVKRRRYLAEIVTDADDAHYIALLASTPTQAESLLHNLEQAAGGIGLNADIEKWCKCVTIKNETSPL